VTIVAGRQPDSEWELGPIEFETPWFRIRRRTRSEDGSNQVYFSHEGPDSALIVPVTEDGRTILVSQYRPPVEAYSLDFPAGRVEADEAPVDAAARELLEETGLTARTFHPLGSLVKDPSFTSQRVHVYLAEVGTASAATFDGIECVSVRSVALEDVKDLIGRGEISCALCVAAAYLVKDALNSNVLRHGPP
jgi:ADP-ribose pyrophosphatase